MENFCGSNDVWEEEEFPGAILSAKQTSRRAKDKPCHLPPQMTSCFAVPYTVLAYLNCFPKQPLKFKKHKSRKHDQFGGTVNIDL